jgi:hypothetical protein
MGVWTFMALAPQFKEASLSLVRSAGRSAHVPSLRRHDPDQVRRVAASAASQPLTRDTPENGAQTTPRGARVKRGRVDNRE